MAKKCSLIDAVKAAAAARVIKPASWFSRLSAAEQKEVMDIKIAWKRGDIPCSCAGLSKTLVEECRKAGIKTCGHDGMREWLTKD